MNETLLEKAMRLREPIYQRVRSTPEQRELALAWFEGRISSGAVSRTLYDNRPNLSLVQYRMSVWLRDAIRLKEVEIVKKS